MVPSAGIFGIKPPCLLLWHIMKSQIEGGGEEAESFGAFFKYSMSYTLLSSSCFLNLSFKTYSMAFTS